MRAYRTAAKSRSSTGLRTQHDRAVSPAQWLLAAVVVLLLILTVWYFVSRPGDVDEAAAPAASRQAVPDLAREVISGQQQEQSPDYTATLEQARSLRAEGNMADAQLLYFFAARGGHAPAAFELGELYDPLHFDASSSLMDEPDAFQAYKWYQQAAQAGNTEADMRLQELQMWVEQAAADGDVDAEQLLLQWN